MQPSRDSALQVGAPGFSLPLLLLPGSGKDEVLISVSRKQWGLNSSSQRSDTELTGKQLSRKEGESLHGGNREHFLTQQESARPECCWSFWCVWIKSAGAGCAVKREGIEDGELLCSRPFQYPPLLSAGSAAECEEPGQACACHRPQKPHLSMHYFNLKEEIINEEAIKGGEDMAFGQK